MDRYYRVTLDSARGGLSEFGWLVKGRNRKKVCARTRKLGHGHVCKTEAAELSNLVFKEAWQICRNTVSFRWRLVA